MAEILTSSLLKKIRHIQYQTTHLADDILAGAYRSAFRGRGMEFEEVREYQPGDDVRSIDWNVTARMNHPYVKSFREEREMTITLMVDISASTRYGSGIESKRDVIAEVAAMIAFSAIKSNDKIAMLLFSGKVEKYYPAKKGTRHVMRLVRELLTYTPTYPGTNIGEAMAYLGRIQKRAGICFLISDFICPDYSHEAALIAKRQDLVAFALVDPTEVQFPKLNLVQFTDLETGEHRLLDTSSLVTKTADRLKLQESIIKRVGGDFFAIHTEIPLIQQFKKFFRLRQKRRQ